MSSLASTLQHDLNTARKAQDRPLLLLLSTIIADVKNRELEASRALTDDDVIEVLRRGIKRRRESAEMYVKGNREELAAKEREEVAMIERYLPAPVSADELRAAVRAAIAGGAANVGAVMGRVMPQFKGRAEGGAINAIAREELSNKG